MNELTHKNLEIQNVCEFTSNRFTDLRGSFYRGFCEKEINQIIDPPFSICQVNVSHTAKKGSVRGLHFQHPPHSEAKLVRCLSGKLFDVVVDLRKDSPTFLKSCIVILDPEKANMLYLPKGCAHGFQAMTDDVLVLYMHDGYYHPDAEDGIHFLDETLKIEWPLEVTEVSPRDQQHKCLTKEFEGLVI